MDNIIKILYKNNCALIFAIFFLLFNSIENNLLFLCNDISNTHLIKYIGYLKWFFLIFFLFFISLSILLIYKSIKNISFIKDSEKPSKFGEFKDNFILYPFIIMTLIGVVKLIFIIIFPCENIKLKTQFIIILILIIGISAHYLPKIIILLKKKLNNLLISFLIAYLISLYMLNIITNLITDISLDYHQLLIFSIKEVSIYTYLILFFIGYSAFRLLHNNLKENFQDKNFKLFNENFPICQIILFIFSILIIIYFDCNKKELKTLIQETSKIFMCLTK